jgi:hypothetical protein
LSGNPHRSKSQAVYGKIAAQFKDAARLGIDSCCAHTKLIQAWPDTFRMFRK